MLSKILFNIEIHELLSLRSVNTHWQAVIESVFKAKQFLYLKNDGFFDDCDNLAENLWLDAKKTSVGFEKKDFIFFKLETCPIVNFDFIMDFCTLLHKLFPNLETLAININRISSYTPIFDSLLILPNQWSSTITTLSLKVNIDQEQFSKLFNCLNSLTHLKQLHLDLSYDWKSRTYLFTHNDVQPLQTLARLERFSFYAKTSYDGELLRYLGSNCIHLKLTVSRSSEHIVERYQPHREGPLFDIPLKHMNQWVKMNPGLFHQLTHLQLILDEVKDLELICQQALQLQELDVEFYWKSQVRITVNYPFT